MRKINKNKDFETTSVEVPSRNSFNEFGIVTSKVPFSFIEVFVEKSSIAINKFLKENKFNFPLTISIFHNGGNEIILKSGSEKIDLQNLLSVSFQYHFQNCHKFEKEVEKFLKREEEIHKIIHSVFLESKIRNIKITYF
ncbi:MAG: hypothetical protein WA101_00970 [Minisyncoccia bacterium]